MRRLKKQILAVASFASLLLLSACGGGGGGAVQPVAATANQIPVVVEQFNAANPVPNRPYVTVTVCDGANQCQDIDHVLLDTGSSGLRLMPGVLNIQLPGQQTASGAQTAECVQYGAGYFWGAQRLATLRLAGEIATAIPITVAGDSSIPSSAPPGCVATGPNAISGQPEFKGILGIGPQAYDCGPFCSQSTDAQMYFSCTGGASGSCKPITMPVADQTPNPIIKFLSDNNGSILSFPAAAQASGTLLGSLIFGIGTQANNQLAGRNVYQPVVDNMPFPALGANIDGVASFAFLDSGTNAYAISQGGTPGILNRSPFTQAISGTAVCGQAGGPYCPSQPVSLQIRLNSLLGTPSTYQSIQLANPAQALQDNLAVVPGLAFQDNPFPGYSALGLPFYFGRSVMTAIDGVGTPYGVGPYWAF